MSTIAEQHVSTPAHASADGESIAYKGDLSHAELEALAELSARRLLCVGADEAFAMLDRGELKDTHAESTLLSLRWLLDAA